MLTRKHFTEIAEIIGKTILQEFKNPHSVLDFITIQIEDFCISENSNFDIARFRSYITKYVEENKE